MDTSYVPRGEDKEGTELLLSPLSDYTVPGFGGVGVLFLSCSIGNQKANKP